MWTGTKRRRRRRKGGGRGEGRFSMFLFPQSRMHKDEYESLVKGLLR